MILARRALLSTLLRNSSESACRSSRPRWRASRHRPWPRPSRTRADWARSGSAPSAASFARGMIATVRAATDRPFNVNVFCNHPAVVDRSREAAWLARLAPVFRRSARSRRARLTEIYRSFVEDDAMLAVLLEERPRVVSFHFGLPSAERIAALRDAGIVLLATATNLEEARSIATAGVDAVVAQGYEAGGHRGVIRSRSARRSPRNDRPDPIAGPKIGDPGDRGRRHHGRGWDRRLSPPRCGCRSARHGLHRVPGVRGRCRLPGRAVRRRLRAHRDDDGDLRSARPLPRQPIHGPRG